MKRNDVSPIIRFAPWPRGRVYIYIHTTTTIRTLFQPPTHTHTLLVYPWVSLFPLPPSRVRRTTLYRTNNISVGNDKNIIIVRVNTVQKNPSREGGGKRIADVCVRSSVRNAYFCAARGGGGGGRFVRYFIVFVSFDNGLSETI